MSKKFSVGAKAVITVNGKVLLLKKIDYEKVLYWDFPGGRVEDSDDNFEDALSREIRDELPSINSFKICNILNAYKLNKNLDDGYGLSLLYYRVETSQFKVNISDEHIDYKRFSYEELTSIKDSDVSITEGNLKTAYLALT